MYYATKFILFGAHWGIFTCFCILSRPDQATGYLFGLHQVHFPVAYLCVCVCVCLCSIFVCMKCLCGCYFLI
jgi:hypothetical protein